jgi:hypothetical protein
LTDRSVESRFKFRIYLVPAVLPKRSGSLLAMTAHRAASCRVREHAIMNTHPGTVTVWQSGRLAPRAHGQRFGFTREQGLGAALLALSACVLAMFVAVLEQDVDRNELQHAAQRSRAVAEAQCEADQPADRRGRCIALFDGESVAAQAATGAAPDNGVDAPEPPARGETVSLLSAAR